MSDIDYRPLLKNALEEIRDLRARLEAARSAPPPNAAEPIAIVGMGCRFPGGADDPASFWELLAAGRDAITEVPPSRWDIDAWYDRDPGAPGKTISRWGGFVDGIDRFDRGFFSLSGREAAAMDPQHRWVLETAWEALEDAGQPPDSLRGSPTCVFLGAYATDYSDVLAASGVPADAYSATGNGLSFAAGRLAYELDLRGPAIMVDTACSSALVAVDLACRALWRGECRVGIAGGVNAIVHPTLSVLISKLFALSADGRCRTFDAAASGFVRGEGCGIVVLKRLSDALAAGDRVRAVIRSSVVNQDGHGTGLTAPNVVSQQALLRSALALAGIGPEDVGLIEAHGTGTPLGDPIELDAIKDVFGAPRADGRPLRIGSVKTNIGHLEAAAGMAGLIKAVLCLERAEIPPHLHLRALNPHVSFDGTPFVIPTALVPWETDGAKRIAGVSAFGMSGTNAHLIVAQADEGPGTPADPRPQVIPLSARSPEALRAVAARTASWLRGCDAAPADVAYSAGVRRTAHRHRLAVVAASRDELVEQLEAYLRDERRPGMSVGRESLGSRPRTAFVYSGQGSQWVGMGLGLLHARGPFRTAVEEVDAAVAELAGWSVIDQLRLPEGQSRLQHTAVAQPVLFALQVGLTAVWREWGLVPDAVVGHSVGEIAAAHVAGVLGLADAVRVAVHRGELLERSTGHGRMVAVDLGPDEATRAIGDRRDRVSVGAHNGPRSTVLTGEPAAIAEITAELVERGVACRPLRVDYAFHSPQMDPWQPELVRALAAVAPKPATVPLFSTVTGRLSVSGDYDARYWARNIREPVAFAPAISALLAGGTELFVEIGPHPVLVDAITRGVSGRARVVHSLRRDHDDRRELLAGLGEIWSLGAAVDWRRQHPSPRAPVDLPTYPWQRERCWVEPVLGAPAPVVPRSGHPLAGVAVSSSLHPGTRLSEARITTATAPFLADHQVEGTTVFPAAAYLELAVEAALGVFGTDTVTLEDVAFREVLVVPADGENTVQVATSTAGDRLTFQIASARTGTWTVHSDGAARSGVQVPGPAEPLDTIRGRCADPIDGPAFYEAMATAGLQYGPRFQSVRAVSRRDGEAIADLVLPPSLTEEAGRCVVHPAVLDGLFQVLGCAAVATGGGGTYVPVGLRELAVHARPSGALVAHARLIGEPGHTVEGDLVLYERDGSVVLEARGLRAQRIGAARDEVGAWLHEVRWEPATRSAPRGPARWLIVGDGAAARDLAAELERRGDRCVVTADPAALGDGVFRAVVCLAGVDVGGDVAAGELSAAVAVARTVRALAETTLRDPPRLVVVTVGTVPAGSGPVAVHGAGLWGLVRSLGHEHPDWRPTAIDLGSVEALGSLADELQSDDPEDQVAIRGSDRFVARLVRAEAAEDGVRQPAAGRSFGLSIDAPGILDRLTLREQPRRAPGPGEVEVEVHAAGLNFLDVLLALGVLPDDGAGATGRTRLGAECAGTVVAVGAGVDGLSSGQAVLVLGPSCLGSHVTVPATLVAPIPAGLSMAEAASIPVTFCTAWVSLVQVARLARGERVLIHAAAGGVGLAAVQIARHLGAEILATAGSEEKRALLRSLGVAHVFDSRSLSFVDGVREATGGQGVDVVLNSLAGEFIPKSFGLLREYGRFVEIGKRDYYEDRKLGLRPFLSNLSFSLVDLRAMLHQQTDRVRATLGEVLGLVASGALQLPPVRVFPVSEAGDAFRWMAQGRHVGKVVLDVRDPAAEVVVRRSGTAVRTDATYLVSGGLGGLGLEVAGWLAERGARRLVLVGRSAPSEAARAALAALEARGVEVVVEAADVADPQRVTDLVARCGPSLRGIVHAAGILDDGVVRDQIPERFAAVLAPKVAGGWNLHRATLGLPLDFFVLFSSAAGVLGSPGQGNYAAANTFLDALAHHRRRSGLPALSVDWGAWTTVGMAAREARLTTRALPGIAPAAGLRALERLLDTVSSPQVTVVPFGPTEWRQLAAQRETSFLSGLVVDLATDRDTPARAELFATEGPARRARLEAVVRLEVAKVLRVDPAGLDPVTPLRDLGIDSLMAIELRNHIEATLGVALPSTVVWNCPTVAALVPEVARRMGLALDEPEPEGPALDEDPAIAELLSLVGDLSPQALDELAQRNPGVST